MKGIFEFEVEGVKRGFKFGTYALSIACEKEDCSVDVLYKRCGIPYTVKKRGKDGKEEEVVKADPAKLKSLLHLFYGAAVHYAEDFDLPNDFKPSTVSNWLDEIGLDKLNSMIVQGLTQYSPKNSKSLAETGEMISE
jgi:hypothetical protein